MLAVITAEVADLRRHAVTRYVATLADFARRHELALVVAEHEPSDSGLTRALFGELARALPRHRIHVILIDARRVADSLALIGDIVDDGAVAVAVTTAGAAGVAGALADRLAADVTLRLTADARLAAARPGT